MSGRAKKYDVIARDLSALIDTKKPGDKLPSELELAATYKVSAMTVRRAIQILTESGRIEGIPGRGTFVRAPTVMKAMASTSFSDTVRASGRTPSSKLISAAIKQATQEELQAFELPDGSSVLHIERVRFGDDVALCVEHATLPADRFPGLLGHDLEASLYNTLRLKYDVEVTWTRYEVQATTPHAEAARHLGISNRTSCLRTRTVSRDQNGTVIERTTTLYRGDFYTLTLETGQRG